MNLCIMAVAYAIYFALQSLSLGVTIVVYGEISNSHHVYLSEMAYVWNYGPVTSISTSGVACSKSEESLIKDYWMGTVSGCDGVFGITRDSCDEGLLNKDIAATPLVQYKVWKRKNICGTRLQSSYFDLTIAKDINSCPSGQRACGIIDVLGNYLCMPMNSECPINYIQFLKTDESDPLDVSVTGTLELTDGRFIYSNKVSNGTILLQFKLSENIPCADPYYINSNDTTSKLDYFYERDNCKQSIGKEVYDKRYTFLDSYTKGAIYEENQITALVSKYYSYQASTKLNLYTRTYIGISKECNRIKSSLGKAIIAELSETSGVLISANNFALVGLAFTCVSVALYIVVFVLYAVCGRLLYKGETDSLQFFKFTVEMILGIGFVPVICIILNSIQAARIFQLSGSYSILNDRNCVDELTYFAITSTLDMISLSKILSIISILGHGICLCIVAGTVCWFYKEGGTINWCGCHNTGDSSND